MLSSKQYIPLFEDVCKVCVSYNLIMNIELKESPFIDEILEKVMAVAKRYDPESKLTRISSFDIPILHTVIKKYPEIPVGSLYNSGKVTLIYNSRGSWDFLEKTKGQLISKCPYVVFKSPKNPSKKFPGFLP